MKHNLLLGSLPVFTLALALVGCTSPTVDDADESYEGAAPQSATPVVNPTTPAPTGPMCGGIAGRPCAEDFYCQYPEGSCGNGDQTGTCQKKTNVCPFVAIPVCGCNGSTYINTCVASRNGVSIVHSGGCE